MGERATEAVGLQLLGFEELMQKWQRARMIFVNGPSRYLEKVSVIFVNRVKTGYFNPVNKGSKPSPGKLTSRVGGAGLMGSVLYKVEFRSPTWQSVIGVPRQRTGGRYAKIHETGEPTIVPRTASALRFQTWDGMWHTVKSVRMPRRPFLEPVAKEIGPKLPRFITLEVSEDLRKAGME